MSQYANNYYPYPNSFSLASVPWAQQPNPSPLSSNDERSPAGGNNPTDAKSELASLFGSYADMRAANTNTTSQGEMTLGDIFDMALFDDSDTPTTLDSSTVLGGAATGGTTTQGVTDSSVLQSYLAQLLGVSPTTETPTDTITPDELWRGSTPTYVPPTSFDIPTGNNMAAGNNYTTGSTRPAQQSNEPTARQVPSSTPTSGDSAPGPPHDDSSSSPALDIEIKTEPDLEFPDGRPTRAMPSRASKSRRRIPLDAPIQQRNYNGPSRTAAKILPKGFEKALPEAAAAGIKRRLEAEAEAEADDASSSKRRRSAEAEPEEEEDEEEDPEYAELARTIKDKVALKRAKNTLAARKSRARKAQHMEELEIKISEREQRIIDLERMIRERDVEIRMLKELQYPDGM